MCTISIDKKKKTGKIRVSKAQLLFSSTFSYGFCIENLIYISNTNDVCIKTEKAVDKMELKSKKHEQNKQQHFNGELTSFHFPLDATVTNA